MDKIKLLLLCLLSFQFKPALAVELPQTMKSAMSSEISGMPSLLNLVVSMVIVIGLIYVTGWIYSKLNIINRNKLKQLTKDDFDSYKFNVIQSMSLGQQRQLYSIEMNGKVLLVGSTPSHISLLKEFDKDESNTEEHKNCSNVEKDYLDDPINIDDLYKKYKNWT